MISGHRVRVTTGSAGVGISLYLCTSSEWVALGAFGLVCLTAIIIYKLSQNRGGTKKNRRDLNTSLT